MQGGVYFFFFIDLLNNFRNHRSLYDRDDLHLNRIGEKKKHLVVLDKKIKQMLYRNRTV